MARRLRRFLEAQAGATAIEYALIAAILGIGVATGATGLGETLRKLYDFIISGYQQG